MTTRSLYPNIAPSLSLDFANVENLDPRITFARASTATYYNGVTTAKAEENLLLQSQTFDDAAWTKTACNVTANTDTAPDGTTTAELLTASVNGTSGISQSIVASTNTHTCSVFAKAGTCSWIRLMILGTSNNNAWFDLTNGVVGTVEGTNTAAITSVGNGWYRCSVTSSGTGTAAFVRLASGNGITTAVNGTTLLLWGAQLEQRSTVTAYTPTTTQPITNYVPVLLSAANNVARFDHNPVTGESLGLLIEEQRTNLLLRSEEFNDASWGKVGSSITENTIVAPAGTLTGDYVVETATTGSHRVSQTFSAVSGTAYTQSVFAKAGARSFIQLFLDSVQFGVNAFANFNLSTGTIGTVGSSATATITPVGNGWYRCTITVTASSTSSSVAYYQIITSATSARVETYTGDGFSGIYIWGAQLEAGAFPTSYIPTVASQVTRSADAASMTGANFSSWYSADNVGSMYVEANEAGGVTSGPWWLNNGTSLRGIAYRRVTTGITLEVTYRQPDGTLRATSVSNAIPYGQANKVATSFDSASTSVSVNGAAAVSSSSSNLYPAVDQLRIGFAQISGNAPYVWCGAIKKLAFYPKALTAAELAGLTQI